MRISGKVLLLPVVPALGLLGLAAPSASAASFHQAPAIRVPHVPHGPAARFVAPPRRSPDFGTKTSTYVAVSGTDTGTCQTAHPCATISYAESQTAVAGTIHVAAGSYNQSANLTQPVHLVGAGAGSTTIDGSGIDYTANGYYGILAVNNNSGVPGTIAISGLKVTHPYLTAAEAAQDESPTDIANMDQQSGDTVKVTGVAFGPAQDEVDYSGIGYYSLNSQSVNQVENDTASGMFQAYFAEGSGAKATTFAHDTATNLVPTVYQSTTYAPIGVFALADTSATLKVTANANSFTGYAGFGIAGMAGYSLGNCTQNVCTGGLVLHASHNGFGLLSAPKSAGVAAIALSAGLNDSLTAILAYSSGTVARPDKTVTTSSSGGTVNVTDTMNTIKVTS